MGKVVYRPISVVENDFQSPDDPKRGVLSTRSPCRPSPLGITVVEVLEVKGSRIKVTGLDALNGSPILDIKPYKEHFDSPQGLKWERSPDYRPKDALST